MQEIQCKNYNKQQIQIIPEIQIATRNTKLSKEVSLRIFRYTNDIAVKER